MKKMTVVKILVVVVFLIGFGIVLYAMGAFDPGLASPPNIEPIFDTIAK